MKDFPLLASSLSYPLHVAFLTPDRAKLAEFHSAVNAQVSFERLHRNLLSHRSSSKKDGKSRGRFEPVTAV